MTPVNLLIQDLVEQAVSEIVKEKFPVVLEHPADAKWGDFSTNAAMMAAKHLKQSPQEIAKKLCYKIEELSQLPEYQSGGYRIVEHVEIAGPGFINLSLSAKWLQKELAEQLLKGESYRTKKDAKKERIFVEFSSPNPNHPLHIGQARNNFLGSSLANILTYNGYEVLKSNYINNWGSHICKCMLMYEKYGGGKEPDIKSDHFVGKFYAMFEAEAEKNPALEQEAQAMFIKLESGDPEVKKLWEKVINWAFKGWERTYADENVSFDLWQYQSDYAQSGKDIAEHAIKLGIAEKDETGAIVARLEKYDMPDKVLLRSDGTSIYSTQDLELARDSFEKYNLSKRIYVTDYRQNDYFRQIFKILEIFGYPWAKNLYHIGYGVIRLPEGNMSSRKGLVVLADDVFDKLVELEKEELKKRGSELPNQDEVARQVALAAFRYPMLKVDSRQDIVFDYSYVTRFEGDTGPYLQYTHARACSILRKADFKADQSLKAFTPLELETYAPELKLLRFLYRFDEVVAKAGEDFAPSLLCSYVFDLAQRFNSFYTEVPILTAVTEESKRLRLLITAASAQTLQTGLNLLGIDAPQKM